ncbi:hypothetical protein DFP73DRAFT_333707 [Morchella snyderi]|nr:hypothetical protein DFP73DRAFT_333707 [Morchella snyderi]
MYRLRRGVHLRYGALRYSTRHSVTFLDWAGSVCVQPIIITYTAVQILQTYTGLAQVRLETLRNREHSAFFGFQGAHHSDFVVGDSISPGAAASPDCAQVLTACCDFPYSSAESKLLLWQPSRRTVQYAILASCHKSQTSFRRSDSDHSDAVITERGNQE